MNQNQYELISNPFKFVVGINEETTSIFGRDSEVSINFNGILKLERLPTMEHENKKIDRNLVALTS